MTIDLDDVEAITPIDPGDMLGAITAMPQHVRTGFAAGNEAPGMPQADGVTSIVFAGMGGSAIAGDVLRTLARGRPGNCHVLSAYRRFDAGPASHPRRV